MLTTLIGAFLLTYFISRGLRFLLMPGEASVRLALVHLLSLVAIAALVIAVRLPSHNFALAQLPVFILPQAFWFALDLVRSGRLLAPRTNR